MDRDHAAGKVTLSLEEDGYPELWDAMSGKIAACVFRKKDGRMEIPLTFAAGEEKLLDVYKRQLVHIPCGTMQKNQWIATTCFFKIEFSA